MSVLIIDAGGNVHRLKQLPKGSRAGDSAYVFIGGFCLWQRKQNLKSRTG